MGIENAREHMFKFQTMMSQMQFGCNQLRVACAILGFGASWNEVGRLFALQMKRLFEKHNPETKRDTATRGLVTITQKYNISKSCRKF